MCKDKECEILSHIRQYHKEYREKNKEKIIESKKQKYYNNREVIIAKNKIYKELHKDEIQKKYSAKTTCICGGSYTYANKTKHLKTKKHLDYITANPSLESSKPLTTIEPGDTIEPGTSTNTIINNNGSSS
jgi:hypothetical protein